jgi:hypothetical protein
MEMDISGETRDLSPEEIQQRIDAMNQYRRAVRAYYRAHPVELRLQRQAKRLFMRWWSEQSRPGTGASVGLEPARTDLIEGAPRSDSAAQGIGALRTRSM